MDSIKTSFGDAVFEDGYMWVFDNLIQAICKINLVDYKMEIISCYKNKRLFYARKIFLFQDKIYLVTSRTTEVLIYDRKKQGKDAPFELQEQVICDRSTKYVAFFLYCGNIYFFPENIDKEVVCFEISTKKYFRKTSLGEVLNRKIKKNILALKHCNFYNESMWFVLDCMGFYGKYSFSDEKIELFRTENAEAVCNDVCFDGEQTWLTEVDSGYVTCVGKQRIRVPVQDEQLYVHPIEEGILVSFNKKEELIFIEKGTFRISIIKLDLNEIERQHVINYHYYNYGDFVYAFNVFSGRVLVLNKKTWEIKWEYLKCEQYIQRCLEDERKLLNESRYISLEQLLKFCGNEIISLYRPEKDTAETGKAIWKVVG